MAIGALTWHESAYALRKSPPAARTRANAEPASTVSSHMLSTTIDDIRHGVRRLLAQPVYSLLAVLTLAAGVGGTAATSTIARGVLFDRLPFAHADEVGVFWK